MDNVNDLVEIIRYKFILSGSKLMWNNIIEKEKNAIKRTQLRQLFFQAGGILDEQGQDTPGQAQEPGQAEPGHQDRP